jgi:NADPH-dependent glutamate synthase beta subunit-like oxidoreductase
VKSLADVEADGPSIAIVGAGPSGLAAAHDLAVSGARVTLFDRQVEPGGLLTSCIPEFRLPEKVVREDVDRILSLGIHFQGNAAFNDIPHLTNLLSGGYAAVLLAVGAGEDKVPEIGGWTRGTETVTAIGFLQSFRSRRLEMPGRRVIVVGGGNAALDAARAALRAKAAEVRVLYRRDWSDMPALHDEIKTAMAEGVQFHTMTLPVDAVWEGGRLTAVRAVNTRADGVGLEGRCEIMVVDGTEHLFTADMIISAIGQEHPLRGVLGLVDPSGNGRDRGDGQGDVTLPPGLYACGDFVAGPSSVVDAIASGRRAAAEMRAGLAEAGTWSPADDEFEQLLDDSIPAPATPTLVQPAPGDLTNDSATALAGNCLRCDYSLRLHTDRCVLCGECAVRCTEDSLRWSRDARTGAYALSVNDSTCTRCGDCVNGCPVGAIHWSLWTRRNRNIDPQRAVMV